MSSERRRRTQWWFGPVVASATLLALFIFAEGIARVVWWSKPAFPTFERPEALANLPTLDGIGAITRPNVRGIYNGVLYESNSAGFRGPERSHQKDADVYRIAVVGDSFAMGSGVLYEESYPARLEASFDIAPHLPNHRLEVLNFGVAGYRAGDVTQRLRNLALRYEPDLVVYGYTLNDIENGDYRRSVEPRFVNSFFFDESPLYTVRLLGARWNSVRGLFSSLKGTYRFELEDNYFDNPPAWAEVERQFDQIASIADDEGVCVVLFVHAQLYALGPMHPYERLYEAISRAGATRGFQVLRSYPYFRGMDHESLWVYPWDAHPGPRGHEVLYDALAEGLRAMPASCWTPDSSDRVPRL